MKTNNRIRYTAFLPLIIIMFACNLSFSQNDSIINLIKKIEKLRLEYQRPLVYDKVYFVERVRLINMIPNGMSDETGQDSEPNLAVDPSNVQHIVGSAFTRNPTGSVTRAPIFISTNGGTTWDVINSVPSGNGMTGDISIDFARRNHTLYTGILRGGSSLRQMILRSANPFTDTLMTTLRDHNTEDLDQPYVTATTANDSDRVYVGFNEYDNRIPAPYNGNGRTASVEHSMDARTAAAPAGLTADRISARNAFRQDMPAIRCAVHNSGVVYAIFYRWTSGNSPHAVCDVIVCRDDDFARGATPFTALTDPSDNIAGRIIVSNRIVRCFNNAAYLGENRLVASNLSIAVDPNNSARVFIAWADSTGANQYTLHVRSSTDSGATWSTSDLITINNATNPALAINSKGTVGFLYQRLTGTAPNQRWQTHFRRRSSGGTWTDMIFANTPDNNPAPTFQPYIGDYCDLVSVGRPFYGIFSACNYPDSANFPQGVIYKRNVNFTTHVLRNTANTANVNVSIDPFFFKVTPPVILDICDLHPWICGKVQLERERIIIDFDPHVIEKEPKIAVDFIPKNCLVKWNCPGCGKGALCPPYFHIFLEDIDPEEWKVQIYQRDGELVKQEINRIKNGLVISFRPGKRLYREKEIGDFYLGFESLKKISTLHYEFKTRLEVSDYRYSQHITRVHKQ